MNSLCGSFSHIVVLDTETTGFSPQRDEIIELGAVRLRAHDDGFVPNGTLSCLVSLSPGRRLPYEIVRLTGITETMLDSRGIPKAQAAVRFAEFISLERTLIVAYNAQFDLNFLYYFLARAGCADCLKRVRFLDALTVYRDRRPYPHRLENAIAAYGLGGEAVNSHRALDDANATWHLLRVMGEEKDDLKYYVNLFGHSAKYGVSGKRIRSVRYLPQTYEQGVTLYDVAGIHTEEESSI